MRISVASVNAHVTSGHCMFECRIDVYCQRLWAGNPSVLFQCSQKSLAYLL